MNKVKRCPACGSLPCHQTRRPDEGGLATLMLEHPELPVLLMGDMDDAPCCYVDMLCGSGRLGYVGEYGHTVWDDLDDMTDNMREEGYDEDEIAEALSRAKPCIWAYWGHWDCGEVS